MAKTHTLLSLSLSTLPLLVVLTVDLADQIAEEKCSMEPATEGKEVEQEQQQLHARKEDAPTAATTAAEEDGADSEENERRNRELKAGLHPLRVRTAALDLARPQRKPLLSQPCRSSTSRDFGSGFAPLASIW